jgi:hypothetical protein
MRRIKFAGLAAVVLVATLGVLASSASATTPTWVECGKVAKNSEKKYTGKYEKGCAQKNEAGEGKYEIRPGVGKHKAFKEKGGAASLEVETPYGNFPIKCGSSSTEGTPAVPNLETGVSFAFKKCSFVEHPCQTPGAKKGELKGSGLVGELGYIDPEGGNPRPAVGLEIKNPGGEADAMTTFECGEGGYIKLSKLQGAVIGVVEKDVNVLTDEQTLTYKALKQFKEHEFGGKKYTPLVNIVGFESEVEKIEECAGMECTNEYPAHVIRGEFCGKFIEGLIGEECTPPTYAGLNSTDAGKGETLKIEA